MNKRKKRLPIGLSDYKSLIDENFYYVDKTLLIQELFEKGGAVTLIPRPRRFGKTLNLSMLKYFFEKTDRAHAYLFEDKKIWSILGAREMQGKFPVIFLTFKDVKESTWEVSKGKLIEIIAKECSRHKYLLESHVLEDHEKEVFKNICARTAHTEDYHRSLFNLSDFLERYHQEKVIVLIDEYDSPIHAGYLNNYYKDVIEFVRGFLCAVLKDNIHLKRGVLTGILRTAKEGIFSGLNNLEVATLLQQNFADKFGFTQGEIDQMLADYGLEAITDDFKLWYNGYLIGNTKMYNPWSALNCVKHGGEFIPYWANTSDNGLIAKIIATSKPDIKNACGKLLEGKALIDIPIEDKMVLPGMTNNSNAIWSLFLFAGYVTVESSKIVEGIWYTNLVLPNKELKLLFKSLITELFEKNLSSSEISAVDEALRDANGKLFALMLSKFVSQSMSWHDISDDEPEISYHLFVLGFLVTLSHRYSVRSNRESGYGRYDIMIIPHDKNFPSYIIEFKKKDDDETMEECAQRALEQIAKKNYAAELHGLGITNFVSWGIAFYKKQVLLRQL